MLSDFLSLIFPSLCAACHASLYKGEDCICTSCLYKLPETSFHLDPVNPVLSKFRGRIPVEFATSCYHFNKGEKVQALIHQLKYNSRKDVGLYLGRRYGLDLLSSPQLGSVDAVIAVPLHKRRERRRGFNQSESIARGIAESLQKPFIDKFLLKVKDTNTQTRRGQHSRWENVKDAFALSPGYGLESKHLLLVDDVITTGSTIEACVSTILQSTSNRISIASMAYASL